MSKRRLVYSFLTVVFVLFLSTPVFGAGFALYEGSARGNVLGAGLVASANDASAVFYNPAGITQLKGIQTMIGATAITPFNELTTTGQVTARSGAAPYSFVSTGTAQATTDFNTNWFFPPQLYYTQQINDRWWVGAGVFSRFGLGTEYDPQWAGRFNSYKSFITTAEFNPNVAYKISDKLSVAAGLSVMYMDLDLRKYTLAPGTPATAGFSVDSKLTGDSWGWGLNLALWYQPVEQVQLGLTYRSRVSQHIEGDAEFVKGASIAAASPTSFRNTSAAGNITLPDMVFAGINWKALPNLSVGGGVYWTRWSTYDQLQVNYATQILPGVAQSTSVKNWNDVYRFMIGLEWKATNWMDVRLGYAYDQSPVPDETVDYILPDNDRNMYSLGVGFHQNAWLVDLSYTYIAIKDRSIAARNADGVLATETKNGGAHLIGFSFGYKF